MHFRRADHIGFSDCPEDIAPTQPAKRLPRKKSRFNPATWPCWTTTRKADDDDLLPHLASHTLPYLQLKYDRQACVFQEGISNGYTSIEARVNDSTADESDVRSGIPMLPKSDTRSKTSKDYYR